MESLSERVFDKYRNLVYERFGIHLSKAKKEMVQARVGKLMRKLNIQSYEQYYNLLTTSENKEHWEQFADIITIHKTDFFREKGHFDFIRKRLDFILDCNRRIYANKEIRIWSAGCSTGEEPYSIAMMLRQCLPTDIKVKILATDVSSMAIKKAQEAVYSSEDIDEIQDECFKRYLKKTPGGFMIDENIQRLVTFRAFNLVNPFPFKNTFDMIFCRNVMIYFSTDIREHLVDKFYSVLTSGGLFFIGHSESLTGREHRFKYIQPTIYMRLA